MDSVCDSYFAFVQRLLVPGDVQPLVWSPCWVFKQWSFISTLSQVSSDIRSFVSQLTSLVECKKALFSRNEWTTNGGKWDSWRIPSVVEDSNDDMLARARVLETVAWQSFETGPWPLSRGLCACTRPHLDGRFAMRPKIHGHERGALWCICITILEFNRDSNRMRCDFSYA